MADVQAIVTQLNAAPLAYSVSLLEFSQKTPAQLRQILVQVLCFISPNQKKSLESESLETSTACIMELLRAVNYRPDSDAISFRQGMALGNTDVIYPLLSWLLPQLVSLKKHVYLSQFLTELEMPGELLMDEDCNILQAQCDALREHFKGNYCRLQSLRKVHAEKDPAVLKDLEDQKHHLALKISKMRSKLQNVSKLDQMLLLLERSRGELSEESNLAEAMKIQKEALSTAAGKHGKALLKLEYSQALATTPPQAIMEKISQEILMLRYLANTKLPKELDDKRRHLEVLQKVNGDPSYSDDKVSRIQAKLVSANNELKALRKRSNSEKRLEIVGSTSSEEATQCKQGALVAERLKTAFDRLTALAARKEQLVVDLSQKTKFIEEIKGTVLRGEELKQFVESLRGKSTTYRTMKKVMDDMISEYRVLQRTQQILENQASTLPRSVLSAGMNDEMFESRNGDEELDNAISTLTSLVAEVSDSVKQNKQKLAPKVKLLQSMKKTKQELEIVHSEKKRHHLEVSSLYGRKLNRLQSEVDSVQRKFELENKIYQEKCAEIETVEALLEEMYKEQQGSGVSAELRAKLEEQEELKETLEQRQQKLKDVEQYNRLQMTMMKDLVSILSAKLKQYSTAARPAIYASITTLQTEDDRSQLFLP